MGYTQLGGKRFLDLLDARVRDRLIRVSRHIRFRAGEIVIEEGDISREVYLLLSGRCDVLVHGDPINQLGPNELFGEIGALGDGARTATVRATEDTELLEISAEDLQTLLDSSPAVLSALLKTLAAQTRRISDREAAVRDEHRELQAVEESLLPDPRLFADSRCFSAEARWQPLTYASGDYCDAVRLGPDQYMLVIGDVMGHGAKTSLTLATVRGELRALVERGLGPGQIICQLDRHLVRHGPRDIPITLAVAHFDGPSGTACWSNAGHPLPLLHRDGSIERLGNVRGPLLGYGFGAEHAYQEDQSELQAGDRILFYTDGLSEARKGPDPRRDMLHTEGLAGMFQEACHNRSHGILEALFLQVDRFRQGYPAQDDATALLVRVN